MRWRHSLALSYLTISGYFCTLDSTSSVVCPMPSVPGSSARNKTCPDFKANPTFIHCCMSKLPPTNALLKERHSVYCCSLEDFEKEKQELATAELRNFLREYLALIIFGSVLAVSLIVILVAIVCKKVSGCPMYTGMQIMSHPTDSPAAMYRPVDTLPPKMYEAPPPYECFVPPPNTLLRREESDWNCVLENEANQIRRGAPP
uniref:Uncharacterized protein n=1 Tax=Caenorhabditis japonica TaxID=281687 RepID=A0A8R1E798_CAEJA